MICSCSLLHICDISEPVNYLPSYLFLYLPDTTNHLSFPALFLGQFFSDRKVCGKREVRIKSFSMLICTLNRFTIFSSSSALHTVLLRLEMFENRLRIKLNFMLILSTLKVILSFQFFYFDILQCCKSHL